MRSTSVFLTAVSVAALAALAAPPAPAFDFAGGGGRLGYESPENLDATVVVGGHVEFEQRDNPLHLQPNLIYWRSQGLSDVNPNLDLDYHFGRSNRVSPYVGGGLGLNLRHDELTGGSDNELDANVIGGIRFPNRGNEYFVESRITAGGTSQVAVLGGITFPGR